MARSICPRRCGIGPAVRSLVCLLLVLTTSWGVAAPQRFLPDQPNELVFPPVQARFVRLVIVASVNGQPCIDELEVYADDMSGNLALASLDARATASSCLPGHAIHQVAHLNDGLYGNAHSWISAGSSDEWAQIELPAPARVAKVVFSRDREGSYRDRLARVVEVRVSQDGQQWQTVCRVEAQVPVAAGGYVPPVELADSPDWDELMRYAFLCERATWLRLPANDHLSPLSAERPATPGGDPYWGDIARLDPLARTLVQLEQMLDRLAAKNMPVEAERESLAELRRQQALAAAAAGDDAAGQTLQLYLDARLVKRRLMLRDPDLATLGRILFVKRHPYLASHNYSDILDSQFRPGGGVCILQIPRRDGRLEPAEAELSTLFDATGGIARDPVADFAASRIYFAYRPDQSPAADGESYWHLMSMRPDGSDLQTLTDGPFHDHSPCPLPDGGLAFISTRCRSRYLCWRPQAFVLFRMEADGSQIRTLSYANLSEWTPAVMRDGRLLWTRSEYLDKGADFGHTLWAIHPGGTNPELIFGNNTPNCYMNGREVPGTREICCTLVSHGGDHNGPIGLIDLSQRTSDPAAITNITPDVKPHYNMSWARHECFRDPVPVSADYFLVSHAAADRFGLYLIDRYGNRELLYLDPAIGSMSASPLSAVPVPPALPVHGAADPGQETPGPAELAGDEPLGQFTVADVYRGLGPQVPRGSVKYLRVCQEVRSGLEQLPNGEFRKDHGPDFTDFYATPVVQVHGPFGWPSYVAKASLGLVPVDAAGSANFYAPAGRVLYFQLLDEQLNEVQRMRSVIQLHAGEQRSCVGCHENRNSSPPLQTAAAALRPPSILEPPSWGAVPFSYEQVVQPVWDAQCVRCHDADDQQGCDLSAQRDAHKVPASYRTLISGGWVHYFDYTYRLQHHKAPAMSFGSLQSKLWPLLNAGHYDVQLTRDEMHRVKCWIDLNCPLWPDYTYRPDRP